MKNIIVLSCSLLLIVSCNSKKSVDVCQTWPPNDSICKVLPNATVDSLTYDFDVQSQGMHGVNKYGVLDNPKDENDVKKMYESFGTVADSNKIKESCFKIKGHFNSQIGKLKVISSFHNWTKLNDTLGVYIDRWGVVLDSGQIIINKQELSAITHDFQFNNNFNIEEINTKYCLININKENKNQILLIYEFNEEGSGFFKPVINSIGTIAKTNLCSFAVKSNGWYSNGKNVSSKPKE
jgi:hypothetical protein